jgi:hypothetical protein
MAACGGHDLDSPTGHLDDHLGTTSSPTTPTIASAVSAQLPDVVGLAHQLIGEPLVRLPLATPLTQELADYIGSPVATPRPKRAFLIQAYWSANQTPRSPTKL